MSKEIERRLIETTDIAKYPEFITLLNELVKEMCFNDAVALVKKKQQRDRIRVMTLNPNSISMLWRLVGKRNK